MITDRHSSHISHGFHLQRASNHLGMLLPTILQKPRWQFPILGQKSLLCVLCRPLISVFNLKSIPIIWISFSSLKSHFTFQSAQTSRRGALDPPASFPSVNTLQQGCKTWFYSSCKAVIQHFFAWVAVKNMEAIENIFKYSEQGVENNIHRSSLCSATQLREHCLENSLDLSDFWSAAFLCNNSCLHLFIKRIEKGFRKSWYFLPGGSGLQEHNRNSFICRR